MAVNPKVRAEQKRKVQEVRLSASQSFNEEEIVLLDTLISMLLRGETSFNTIKRHTALPNLARKAQAMKRTLEQRRILRAQREREEKVANDLVAVALAEGGV